MMIFHRILRLAAFPTVLSILCMSSSCRKSGTAPEAGKETPVVIDTKLRYNRASDVPAALYRSQAGSPIHWQPWTKDTLEMAKKSHRLLFVVIALPQQSGFLTILEHLSANPAVVASLNHEYVPVLVDAEASREIGLLTPMLCAEIKRSLHLPIFLWMTYEANPVMWIPVHAQGRKEVIQLFDQSHGMLGRMWREDADYLLRNHAAEQVDRRLRMEDHRKSITHSTQTKEDVLLALRKMSSLYDPYSRTLDEAGGLFPYGTLELLSVAARRPGISAELRQKCGGVVRELLQDLLPSAMFDPLDGGVYSSRRGPSWVLPSFLRDCTGQARAINALVEAYHATADPLARERALGVLKFAESQYQTEDGLYATGLSSPGEAEDWMWRLEDFKELLPADQAEWWIREAGIKGLGNLPPGHFFRANSIALAKPVSQYAEESPLGSEAFLAAFESSRKKLLDERNARLASRFQDRVPHAGATFRMVSAYAALFTMTKNAEHREKAVALLNAAREAFIDGRFLRSMKGNGNDELSLGRAFHYALALQAALDVAAITHDPVWTIWAEDLATLSAEQFTGDGILKECPDAARMMDLPVADMTMLFDDSTAGLFSAAEARLATLGKPLARSFSELATPLPASVVERPILHTDLLLAALLRHYPMEIVHRDTVPPALAESVSALPIRGVLRRLVDKNAAFPEDAIQVRWHDGQERIVRTKEELDAVLAEILRG